MTPLPCQLPLPLALALACLVLVAPLSAQKSKSKDKNKDTAHAAAVRLDKALSNDQIAELPADIAAFARFDEPASVEALLTVFDEGSMALHPDARRVLGGFSQPASLERLLAKGTVHKSETVRAQVVQTLGEARPATIDWAAALGQALDDPSPLVRAAAVRELGRARIDTRLDRIVELAVDSDERVRAEVPGALMRLGGERTLPQLEPMLKDSRWRVRLETINALADLRSPVVVQLLIEAMEAERGRLQEDIVAALERLTGQEFGFDVASWKDFVQHATPDYLSKPPEHKQLRLGTPRFGVGGLRYHTIGTSSQRFVLITDLSGSMDTPIRLPGYPEPRPRVELVREELTRLVGQLDPNIGFDLITFRDTVDVWKPQMILAGDAQKRAALSQIAGYTASGGTNIYGGLAAVFDIAEAAMEDSSHALQDVDTVFLLSDGAPSEGLIKDTGLLLQYVAERNRTLRLRIHCISLVALGELEAEKFLRQLATLGGGAYTSPATTDK